MDKLKVILPSLLFALISLGANYTQMPNAIIPGQLKVGANSAPHASAVIDIGGTTMGFLPPAMTASQISGISAPATGLHAFSTTTNRPNYYTGSAWLEMASVTGTETLTNKTLNGNTATNLISGSGTLTLNTSGTVTVPNATDTLVGKATTDTLTNKTLNGNTATNLISGSGTFTLNTSGTITSPNATDTLVGKATTDTLTNKSMSGASNTFTSIPNSATTATSANTNSAIVARDGSGNFSAGTISAALTGTASGNTTYTPNQYGVVLSGSGNTMSVLAPDASTVKVLASGGTGANPSWQTVAAITATQPIQQYLWNSGFDFWNALGTSTTLATGITKYTADQWYASNSTGGDSVLTVSQVAGSTTTTPYGIQVKLTTNTTGTVASAIQLFQVLEYTDSMAFYNQNASFTAQVKATNNVTQVGIQFLYATTEVKLTTVIGSETLCTVTTGAFAACTISGQAMGTSMTTSGVVGIRIRITAVSSGNTYDVNNGFIVEKPVMNTGSIAATWTRRGGGLDSELAGCQRFYENSYAVNAVPGSAGGGFMCVMKYRSATLAYGHCPFKVVKRISPTVSTYDYNGGASGSAYDLDAGALSGCSTANGSRAITRLACSGSVSDFAIFGWEADARI